MDFAVSLLVMNVRPKMSTVFIVRMSRSACFSSNDGPDNPFKTVFQVPLGGQAGRGEPQSLDASIKRAS